MKQELRDLLLLSCGIVKTNYEGDDILQGRRRMPGRPCTRDLFIRIRLKQEFAYGFTA